MINTLKSLLCVLSLLASLAWAQSEESVPSVPAAAVETSATPTIQDFEGAVHGKTNLRLGVSQPIFSSNLNFYKELYGSPGVMLGVGQDWLFVRRTVGLGFGLRMGYYADTGKAAKKPRVDNPTAADLVKDADQTSLTLIPIDLLFVSRLPLGVRWLIFSGWVGYQNLYYQEVRLSQVENSSGHSYISGWNGGLVLGASLEVDISGLDPLSAQSMQVIGLRRILFAPFAQYASPFPNGSVFGKGKTEFGYTNVGISFIFES